MPRTKVTRKAGSNKRLRDNTAEIEEICRELDIETENSIQTLEMEHNKDICAIDAKFDELKRTIPKNILKMKWRDLKLLKDFNDVIIDEKMNQLDITIHKTAKDEEASNRSHFTSDSDSGVRNKSTHQNLSTIGSLKKIKTRRRSKSVSSMITPGPKAMMSVAKGKTPMGQLPVPHISRSKYRTPMNSALRTKAASADRITTITPKANPMNPFSVLRHARVGEAVFSVSGSPIVPANVTEKTANVNIPVANGILSLRPESIDPSNLDTSIINKIDQHTFMHLHTLKANLDIIMAGFYKKFHK